jgi:hypothetical protein
MSLQQTLRSWSAIVAAVLVLALVAAPLAAKSYKAKDLKGTYHYVVTEARTEAGPPDVEYCDSYGTITFDGVGKAYINMELRRCTTFPSLTVEVDVDEPGEFNFVVYPNGEFLMIELDTDVDPPLETDYITHGRIVQRGKLLLVDGTRGCVDPPTDCPHPEFLQTVAVAAKE